MVAILTHELEAAHHTTHFESHELAADEVLVERCMAGDPTAFEELVRRYSETFHRVARGVVKDEAEAQDVVQTAFLNMFHKLHTFQLGSSFKSWAYRVVMNTGLMRLRKRKTRAEVDLERAHPSSLSDSDPLDLSVAPSWSVRADRHLERVELAHLLHGAIQELPPKYHEVFVLREYEQLTLQEISQNLALSVPAVKSRLHRARHFLRASLEPYMQAC